MSDTPLLRLERVGKEYYGNRVLSNVNFSLMPGEILGLVGENGAGKSTLMNILFGMPVIANTGGYEGTISMDGVPVRFSSPFQALEAGIGMVHQEFSLIPGFTAAENILLNREVLNKSLLEHVQLLNVMSRNGLVGHELKFQNQNRQISQIFLEPILKIIQKA